MNFALIALVQSVLQQVSCSYDTIPNASKYYETLVLGPMGWIGCVRRQKSQRDFMARDFALIALVHPVLHRVSCVYETIPNAPKQYATNQNMTLGSNGVDWVRLLQNISTRRCGTYFCINCTSSPYFASSLM